MSSSKSTNCAATPSSVLIRFSPAGDAARRRQDIAQQVHNAAHYSAAAIRQDVTDDVRLKASDGSWSCRLECPNNAYEVEDIALEATGHCQGVQATVYVKYAHAAIEHTVESGKTRRRLTHGFTSAAYKRVAEELKAFDGLA